MKMKPADQLIKDVCTCLTDCIFFYLQNDREFMDEYRSKSRSEQETFNREMGKAIPEYFTLGNDEIATDPRSILIKSYTKHHKELKKFE